MYILKNVFKSITRNKARNILIGIVILVIAITCTVALAISNSADKLIDSYLRTRNSSFFEKNIDKYIFNTIRFGYRWWLIYAGKNYWL